MARPTRRPARTAQNGPRPTKKILQRTNAPMMVRPAETHSPIFRAKPGSEPSLPRTKKVEMMDAMMPMAARMSGNATPP